MLSYKWPLGTSVRSVTHKLLFKLVNIYLYVLVVNNSKLVPSKIYLTVANPIIPMVKKIASNGSTSSLCIGFVIHSCPLAFAWSFRCASDKVSICSTYLIVYI